MTVGKDVSMLLADVVKNGQTENLELKKLVYLYLINYAKSQPDLAILAVNTFVKARKRKRRRSARRLPLRTQHAHKNARARGLSFRANATRARSALCAVAHTRRVCTLRRTRWTPTRSSARWRCARWGASALTKSQSTSATPSSKRCGCVFACLRHFCVRARVLLCACCV
jgi:hypothetical protein